MKLFTLSVLLIASWLGGCSWAPRVGPSTSEVLDQAQIGGAILFDVVEVDDRVVSILRSQPKESFTRRFNTAARPPELKIAVGDTVSVLIWESAAGGLFTEPLPTFVPGARPQTEPFIGAEGGTCEAVAGDVSRADDVTAMVDTCIAAFGRVDVLHNNVGIVEVGGPVETSEESWDRVNDVNLKSMFLTCKHVLPHMVGQGKGAIVNIASVSGVRWLGVPYISYAATKAAIIQFTRVIALQYARSGIRANSILPGMMNTPMVHAAEVIAAYGGSAEEMVRRRDEQCPMGRMGDAWDVAYAALFLASDEAKYVTGTELVVDGGLTVNCV